MVVVCQSGATFMQIELEIWPESMVTTMLRNTGRYFSMQHHSHMIAPKFILQQDNDPKHTAKVIKSYLEHKEEQALII